MLPSFITDGPADAPVLVLSNSLGTTADMWAPQMPALRQHFRVVRYEHRGHGGTPAPAGPYTIDDLGRDLVELLDHLGLERVSLCGLSLGGMVGMWVAAHHPDRIERLVLACTAPYLPPPELWSERAVVVRREGPSQLLDTLLGRWFTPGFVAANPDVGANVARMLARADREGYAACCEAIGAMDQRRDLVGITAPTLVIAGADDPVAPPPVAVELQQAIGGAGLLVVPAAAHLVNVERSEAFTTAVVEHLAGSPAARGERVRRAVVGDAHVDRSDAAATAFNQPFLELITRYAWGEIWSRPGLDRATRSCITIAILTTLGRTEELALHVRGALRNGVSPDQISEVLLHAAVYCGVPSANAAFAVATRVLEEGASG